MAISIVTIMNSGEPNLWREPEPEKAKEELESEAKRKLKEDFPDYT
jgi:hypothetical protein